MTEQEKIYVERLERYMHNARVILNDWKCTPKEKIKRALIWLEVEKDDER